MSKQLNTTAKPVEDNESLWRKSRLLPESIFLNLKCIEFCFARVNSSLVLRG